MPIDDRTTNRSYKLPNAGNFLADDVQRLRDALTAIDADVFARYTKTETDQKLADLINGAPGALDTLNELAAAMGDDPNFAATITNALAGKPGFADVWTRTQADARYVQGVTQTENTFTGTGSQTTFTLSQTPPTRESLLVTVDGVVQPVSEYNLSGSALILSEAPASGSKIRVLMLGVAGPVQSASTINFTPAGTGAVTRTVDSKLKDWVSVKDFGATGNGVTDDSAAINAAIASFPTGNDNIYYSQGGTVYFPPGKYYCASSIVVERAVTFAGANAAIAGSTASASIIEFARNISGFVVHRYNTGTSGKGGDGAAFENLTIQQAASSTVGDGIRTRARILIRNCAFFYWGGNGVRIIASAGAGGSLEGNANNFRIENCVSSFNVGNGFYFSGADANAGTIIGCDASNNGGYGFHEASFLGNTYVGCHVASNTLAQYYVPTNNNARNAFYGCYSEGGYAASDIRSTATLICGGLHAAGFEATTTAQFLTSDKLAIGTAKFLSGVASSTSQWELYHAGLNPGDFLTIRTNAGSGGARRPGIVFQDDFYASQGGQVPPACYSSGAGLNYTIEGGSTNTYQNKTKLVVKGGNDNGFDVSFSSDKGATYSTYLSLDSSGHFFSGFDNTKTLGSAAKRWSVVYAGTGTINTSDGRDKQGIRGLSEAEHEAAKAIKTLIRAFRFNDAVELKGDGARLHVGVIAQDVEQAFLDAGLDPSHYGIFCRDEWWELEGKTVQADEDGTVTIVTYELNGEPVVLNEDGSLPEGAIDVTKTKQATKRERLGIRYEELLAFVLAAL